MSSGAESGAESSGGSAARPVDWQRRSLIAALGVVVLVIGYFVAREVLPSWWSRRMAGLVGGSTGWGIWWGLVFGFAAALLPLFVLRQTLRSVSWRGRGWLILAALLLAAPNLLTLGVVLAGGSDESRLAHRAPGLSGASLVGAVLAAAVFVAVQVLLARHSRERNELSRLRVDEKLRRAGG